MKLRIYALALSALTISCQTHAHTLQSYVHALQQEPVQNQAALAIGITYGTYKLATAPAYNPCNTPNLYGVTAGLLASWITSNQYERATSNLITTIAGIGTKMILDGICGITENVSIVCQQYSNDNLKLHYKVGQRDWIGIEGQNKSDLKNKAQSINNEHPKVKNKLIETCDNLIPNAVAMFTEKNFSISLRDRIRDFWNYITG